MKNTLTRRSFSSALLMSGVAASSTLASRHPLFAEPSEANEGFLHPGMLQSAQDLSRMRAAVSTRQQPVYSGFEMLRRDPGSQLGYQPAGAFEEIGRNPNVHTEVFDSDSNASYQCALMGHITGDKAYFRITATILDRWAATLKRITGADAILCAGLGGFKMANAAELLRYSNAGWPESSARKFGDMLQQVFVPVLHTFAPFANGNWDTAALKTLMAIAIYRDDRDLFERVLIYYNHGCGDGRLENYVYANGQCQESGRDQQHTQLGLAHMGDCCEMAWHQGLDLYGMADNRLLKGFEYTAKYILGDDVHFAPDVDKTGRYRHQVISPRSPLRPVYEQIYNHYNKRRGLPAPWVAKAAEKVRPEAAGFHADHTGFGTLLYTRPVGPDIAESLRVDRPSGLYVSKAEGNSLELSWVPTAATQSCLAIRNDVSTGSRNSLKAQDAGVLDSATKDGHRYRYQIAQADHQRRTSLPISVVAGLPTPWYSADTNRGTALFDGQQWRLSSAGAAFFTVSTPMSTGQALVARLSRQFASQYLRAGLELRAEQAVTKILVEPTEIAHGRGWSMRLYTAPSPEAQLTSVAEISLQAPFTSYNRVDIPLWFQLGVHADQIVAAFSGDGIEWTKLASVPHSSVQKWQAGLTVNSGIENVSTEILMDHVTLTSAAAVLAAKTSHPMQEQS